MTDSEYEIPQGKKVKVTMKAPDLTLYDRFVVIHYLKDGSVEHITPIIKDGLMTFETSSFSPFDVGGSKPLVGLPTDNASKNNGSGTANKGTNVTNNNSNNTSDSTKNSNKKKTTTINATPSKTQQTKASNPRTGDTSVLLPYIIGGAAALIIIILLLVTRKKKKK